MAGFSPVRRVLLVNALIFAVLAAAVALAYYGYSATSEVVSRDREVQLMHDLAEEKVLNIESLVAKDDIALLFPQFFEFTQKRLYQVVDEHGLLRYGAPFVETADSRVVAVPFFDTVDGWVLRVAEKDSGELSELHHKRIVDSLVIGGAVTV